MSEERIKTLARDAAEKWFSDCMEPPVKADMDELTRRFADAIHTAMVDPIPVALFEQIGDEALEQVQKLEARLEKAQGALEDAYANAYDCNRSAVLRILSDAIKEIGK